MKKTLSMLLVLLTIFSVFTIGTVNVGAAPSAKWTVNKVANLTATDAKISSKVSFSQKMTFTEGGFYIGTSKSNLKKNAYPDKINIKSSYLNSSFLMSKYKQTLKPNTTYYYKIYVVANKKTYTSSINSFKTPALPSPSVKASVSEVTQTTAVFTDQISNPQGKKISQYGIQIGTSASKLSTEKKATVNTKAKSVSYKMDSDAYKIQLTANKKYYYRMFAVVDGKRYYSSTNSFTTPKNVAGSGFVNTPTTATTICFPLSTKEVWYATTYVGHGGKNKSAYSAVDITLKNKKSCKGYAVYAVEDGVVINDDYKKSNGQITIKHTKKLVTTNGATYTTWYSTYAHMTNITVKEGDTVKKGQQIGKIGNVGKSKGYHLHFSMSSGNNKTSWYQEKSTDKAISPYYVKGFVNQNGTDTAYLVRDKKGTGVTNQLINHKPSGK